MLIALQSGAFISSFKNLLQMNLSHIRLLEEEAKLPGEGSSIRLSRKAKLFIKIINLRNENGYW